jgi:hypothetical protein
MKSSENKISRFGDELHAQFEGPEKREYAIKANHAGLSYGG